ncbi:haloacid dehalogenase-like hydrolase (HAD) superfamily protein [Actinidia rufa]|uniref:Haloacid dehalogenase-like hydrolase (HAD) superfamily protein n=1 Tax=Actinidia rufa TaxID=165716 RepID=A0A7J0G8L2_9ERIC|nr:haloacid dehalogenase-like hydrolase (HAD) superfamily protein [Actinidia rufa]
MIHRNGFQNYQEKPKKDRHRPPQPAEEEVPDQSGVRCLVHRGRLHPHLPPPPHQDFLQTRPNRNPSQQKKPKKTWLPNPPQSQHPPPIPLPRSRPQRPSASVVAGKTTIFLDLDETLVHSKPDPPPENYDFVVRPVIDNVKIDFYVKKRPFADEFLEFLSRKFEIVIFTAGLEEYASLVLERLDRKSLISHRLYRDSCREVEGKLVKDLGDLGRDLRRVVIVDDNPNSYALQPENAIPILPFTSDLSDFELQRLMDFFEKCEVLDDMRETVKEYIGKGNGDKKL